MLSRETIVSGYGRCNLKIVTMEDEPWKSFVQIKNLRDIMDLRCRRAAVKDVARVGSCGNCFKTVSWVNGFTIYRYLFIRFMLAIICSCRSKDSYTMHIVMSKQVRASDFSTVFK